MASVKITELNPSGPLTGSEVLPIVQGNETVKTTVQEIGSFTRPYKVYTALLTQSGGDDPLSIDSGLLTLGVTYVINNDSTGMDFTNVGAPNNNLGISFVATGTTPSSWGANEGTFNGTLVYNTGAPLVTVLENTIGNIWLTFDSDGNYVINSNGLFVENKSWTPTILILNDTAGVRDGEICEIRRQNANQYNISTFDQSGAGINDVLNKTPIEIRVYN
jgi:hypothetical protein